MKETPKKYCYVETEFRGYSGDSDYIISGELDLAGTSPTVAYVWELKAPQCYIFEKDTEHRLKPTYELIDAENKLLHYYNEVKESSQHRDHFGVTLPDYVRLGGIIIGSNRTKARGFYDGALMDRLYRRAIYARMTMYRPAGIFLVTWDHILDQLKPTYSQNRTIISGERVTVTISKTASEVTFVTLPPETHQREE